MMKLENYKLNLKDPLTNKDVHEIVQNKIS